MAKVSGRLGKIAVSDDGGSNYFTIGEVTSIKVTGPQHDDEDATTFTSAGNKQTDYGETQTALTVDFLYDEADTGQDKVRTSAQNKTKLLYRYRPSGDTSGTEQQTFSGKIDSLSPANERNAKVACSLQLKSDGAVTYNQVP